MCREVHPVCCMVLCRVNHIVIVILHYEVLDNYCLHTDSYCHPSTVSLAFSSCVDNSLWLPAQGMHYWVHVSFLCTIWHSSRFCSIFRGIGGTSVGIKKKYILLGTILFDIQWGETSQKSKFQFKKKSKLIISFISNSVSLEYYKWLCTCLSSYPSHMWVPYMNITDTTWPTFRHILKTVNGDYVLRLVCVCLSTCPYETTQLPMDRFSSN
jgi:hypothetical protein